MNLSVENLTYSYNHNRTLYKNLSFSVNSGDVLAILGPNGVGKTTLLKIILGIIPITNAESQITLDGINIKKISKRELYRKVSYVPQKSATSYNMTVLDNVLIGRNTYINPISTPKKEDVEIALEKLKIVGMLDYKDRMMGTLSGGEAQLVYIARALASIPSLIVLDEPESGLDFKNQLKILNLIEEMSNDNIAIILNTHYPKHALQVANKTLILGYEKYYYGETASCMTEENIEDIFGVRVLINEMKVGDKIIKNVIPLYIK